MPTVPKQKSIKNKKEKDGHCPTKNKQKEKQLQNKQKQNKRKQLIPSFIFHLYSGALENTFPMDN